MVKRVTGIKDFRLRLVTSLLKFEKVIISDIRADCINPGVKEHEVKFLELLTELTQGSVVEISDSGADVSFSPGIIKGGTFDFYCGSKYCIAYFVEPLLLMIPFSKLPTKITFSGLTEDSLGLGMDSFKYFYDAFLKSIDLQKNITVKILERGYPPDGVGKVLLECVPMDKIQCFNLQSGDKMSKVRGMLASTKVNNQLCVNVISQTKELLSKYFDDIFIYTDKSIGEKISPGFSLTLVATNDDASQVIVSNTNSCVHSDVASFPSLATKFFLKKVARSACFDDERLWIVLGFMCIATGVSQLVVSKTLDETVLQDFEEYFGVKFVRSKQSSTGGSFSFKCLGMGLTNVAQEFK